MQRRRFYFAFVDEGTAFNASLHSVKEIQVASFNIGHGEGDFPELTIVVRNPRIGLLNPGRKTWIWFSSDVDGALFFGRLDGSPDQIHMELVQLRIVARPATWTDDIEALAETLRVRPYWDAAYIPVERRTDPHFVLEGYPAVWHIDRVTHAVTKSDYITAEDGLIDIGRDFEYESLRMENRQVPVSRIDVTAEAFWEQRGVGDVDIARTVAQGGNSIATYTGEGLLNDWPEEGDSIGSGWTVKTAYGSRGDGVWIPQEALTIIMSNATTIDFPVWTIRPTFVAHYDVTRSRSEKLTFSILADMQALHTLPGNDDVLPLTFASSEVGEPIDEPDSDNPEGTLPLRDRSFRAYFPTDRGLQSLEYIISVARAQFLKRARAIEVSFKTTWDNGLALSCRKSVRIEDPRLPGGEATGKITGYSLSLDGQQGEMVARVTIGCTVGAGNTVSASAGTPTYAEEGVLEAGVQVYHGQTIMPIAGAIVYPDFSDVPPNDDGVDFAQMTPENTVDVAQIINGAADQKTVLKAFEELADVAAAASALEVIYTEILVEMVPLQGGPFHTDYDLGELSLMVPKTIDLAAASSA